jgi:hypothetical protein
LAPTRIAGRMIPITVRCPPASAPLNFNYLDVNGLPLKLPDF